MAVSPNDIVPAASADAAPAPTAPTAEDTDGDGIPDAILKLPFMAALLAGKPAATYVENDAPPPEADLILEHADALARAGFRIYPSKAKPVTVFYNAAVLPPEELKAADTQGALDQVAVPFGELQEAFAGLRSSKPAPEEGAAPAAPAQPVQSAPTDPKVRNARLKNLNPGAPTSGPVPGQGRILNNILKPVV